MYASVLSGVRCARRNLMATRWASGGSSFRFSSISGRPKKISESSFRSGTSRLSSPRNSSISSRVASICASSISTTARLPCS